MRDELREREEVGQGFTQCCNTKQPWLPEMEGEKIFWQDLDQVFVSNYY